MNISSYEPRHLDKLKRFVSECNYLPYLEYGLSRARISDFVITELFDTVSNGGFVFIAEEAEEIIGLICSEKLEWDSTHFGIETAKINYLLASGEYSKSLNTKQTRDVLDKLISMPDKDKKEYKYLVGEKYHK